MILPPDIARSPVITIATLAMTAIIKPKPIEKPSPNSDEAPKTLNIVMIVIKLSRIPIAMTPMEKFLFIGGAMFGRQARTMAPIARTTMTHPNSPRIPLKE